MKLQLRGRTYETGTSTASPVFYRYGCVEFLNLGGSYIDTFLSGGLYRYAVVHASRITVRAVNAGSEPIILASTVLPHDWTAGSPTLTEMLDTPKCQRASIGSSSGMDRAVIVNQCSAREVLGKDYQIAKYQMDPTQAVSTTPLYTKEPAWVVAVSAFNASTAVSYRLEIEIDWAVEFYNLDSF
jgi:hypothetical protein